MPPGKRAAKAVQAAVNAFAKAPPSLAREYLADGEGTQIILIAPSAKIRNVLDEAEARGVPWAAYPEAVAIGPVTRERVADLTEGLPLM